VENSPDWISRQVPVSKNTDSLQPFFQRGRAGTNFESRNMLLTEAGHRKALATIKAAGIAIEPRGMAYLLVGHGSLLVTDLRDIGEADIARLSGRARSPMRAMFSTRRKCR